MLRTEKYKENTQISIYRCLRSQIYVNEGNLLAFMQSLFKFVKI